MVPVPEFHFNVSILTHISALQVCLNHFHSHVSFCAIDFVWLDVTFVGFSNNLIFCINLHCLSRWS